MRHRRPASRPRRGTARRLTAWAVVPAVVAGCLAAPAVAQAASSTRVPSSFSFSGSGWGHGVGMSQYGAKGQALAGASATAILQHYFTGTQVRPVRDDVALRVNLLFDVDAFQVRGEPLGRSGGAVDVTFGARTERVPAQQPLQVRQVGGSVQISSAGRVLGTGNPVRIRWSGTRDPGSTGDRPAVLNVVAPGQSFTSAGHRYRYGVLEVRSRTMSDGDRSLAAVNVVRLHDEYLRGIGEMPSSWPMAALQAQVIASRAYALSKYSNGMRAGCWCHVYDTTADQVFAGWSKEAGPSGDRWRRAVASTSPTATTGQVVLYRGALARTHFFSSSGGRTQNSEDVWSTPVPYLRSVDDRWSRDRQVNPSFAAWGPLARSQAQVARAFALPDVARLDLSSRYSSGAVRRAVATSSRGVSAVLAGATFTQRLGLTSRWSYITGTPDPMAPRPAPAPAPDPVAAAAAAARAVPTASRTVVLSRVPTSRAVDPWVARPLLTAKRAPLLLTSRSGMPRATAAEIARRDPTTAYVLGSVAVVDATVERQLRSFGVRTIIRVAGADRYAMSAAIAAATGVPRGRSAFVVNGADVSRLRSIAPIAAASGRPILLTRATTLPPAVRDRLRAIAPRVTTVVGPRASVSDAVLRAVPRGVRSDR